MFNFLWENNHKPYRKLIINATITIVHGQAHREEIDVNAYKILLGLCKY